jgi:hypothetical protein
MDRSFKPAKVADDIGSGFLPSSFAPSDCPAGELGFSACPKTENGARKIKVAQIARGLRCAFKGVSSRESIVRMEHCGADPAAGYDYLSSARDLH